MDPTTGNLAVTDDVYGVLIYANATGTPKPYSNSSFAIYNCVGYDNKGNLFVGGLGYTYYSTFSVIGELPKGGSNLGNFSLDHDVDYLVDLQWDGKYLAILNTGVKPNVIDQYSVSGSSGTLVGSTTLDGTSESLQLWVPKFGNGKSNKQGTTVVVASGGSVPYWTYPAGGTATKTITDGLDDAFGVTVSESR